MARGITEQDVFTTADELLTQGQRPTIERIRVTLGRGSPNTVNRHLDAWWAALSTRLTAQKAQNGLPGVVQSLANKLWETALAQSRAKAGQDNELAVQQQIELNKQLQQQHEALDRDRAALDKAIPMLKEELQASRVQLQGRDRRISELETELKRLTTDLRRAESELGRRQADLDKAQARAAGNEKHLMEKLAELQISLKETRRRGQTEVERLRKQLDVAHSQLTASIKGSSKQSKLKPTGLVKKKR